MLFLLTKFFSYLKKNNRDIQLLIPGPDTFKPNLPVTNLEIC